MRLLAVAAVALAGTVVSAGGSHAAFPATKSRLLIVSERSGAASPELIRADGTRAVAGPPVGIRGTAAISPDGTRIALVSRIPYTVPAITPPTLDLIGLLIRTGGTVSGPAGGRASWSPDGTEVVFASDRDGDWDIYRTSALGDDPFRQLVNLTEFSAAADTEPRWSPDGQTIAFNSTRGGDLDVYTMGPDGSGVRQLTDDPAPDTVWDWSPDSQRLVFSSDRSGGGDLYTVTAAGTSVARLTSEPGADTHAAWSPDGKTIAYSSDLDGDTEVYEVSPDGTGLRKVTDNTYEDLVQDWQPLRDVSAPVTRALPSSGRRGGVVRLRYRVNEDRREVVVSVLWSWRTKHGGVFGESGLAGQAQPGKTYTVDLPAEATRNAPATFRFCVQAFDSSLNQSARSCAKYRFLPRKKKR